MTAGMADDAAAHLREVMDERDRLYLALFAAAEAAREAADTAAREAIDKAETATSLRFDSVNEFRAQLADQAATFLSRTEYVTAHATLFDKLAVVTTRLDVLEGSLRGQRQAVSLLFAAIGAVGVIVALVATVIAVVH